MRTCVIFNPTARGEKAKRFRGHLDDIGSQSTLKLTTGPQAARRLAAEAVREGFEIVVAAGGDGTVNEVLNGLGDVPDGFARTRLGVLPLGTVNVFARELGLPRKIVPAWQTIRQGRETLIDLPYVDYAPLDSEREAATPLPPCASAERSQERPTALEPPTRVGSQPSARAFPAPRSALRALRRRYFAQLAGAGLDARAIELVQWELKKRIGPLAYVLAGLHALLGAPSKITAQAGSRFATGGLVLIGNGRLYGGQFRVFPKADLRDGLLEVCVFPRVNWFTLARCGPQLLVRGSLPASVTQVFQAETLTLTSPGPTPLEVDGELIGHLPASFGMERSRLRVIVA